MQHGSQTVEGLKLSPVFNLGIKRNGNNWRNSRRRRTFLENLLGFVIYPTEENIGDAKKIALLIFKGKHEIGEYFCLWIFFITRAFFLHIREGPKKKKMLFFFSK